MRRKLAFLLSAALIAALLAPFALAEETDVPTPEAEHSVEETAAAASAESAAPEEADATQDAGEAADAAEPEESGGRTAVTLPSTVPAKAAAEPDIRFSALRTMLENGNYTYKALEQNMKLVDSTVNDLTPVRDALESLRDMRGKVQYAATMEIFTHGETPLALSLNANCALLEMQIQSLEQRLASGSTTIDTTANTLLDAMDQMAKGVESLYVGVITMEAAIGDIDRGLETLDRVVALTEKQHELGMASAYDVESARHQRSALRSQRESLLYSIKTNKIMLEGMLGVKDRDGASVLEPLTMPTEAELAAVDYKAQVEAARKKNIDVKNADAQDWNEGTKAAEYSLRGARDTFDYKFKQICLAVPEQQRLVRAAVETLEFQNRTLEIAAKKYELGMLSHEEYLAAESDAQSAASSLTSAQLDLFTAYRNYWWACKYGVV